MNLWVDDTRKQPKSGFWIAAKTVGQAVRLIAHNDFEIISLDHDDAFSEDGFFPLVYIIGMKYAGAEKCPSIIIHSMNPVAARRMADTFISEYKIYPRVLPYGTDVD